ncbi:MAG: hypothetical protein ACRDEB_01615 [Chitinophagaceae bacterium]
MKKIIALALLLSAGMTLKAQDRFFARTYTSNVLPKGNIDIEFWHTSRFGHKGQYFNAQDQRMEIEFGLGKNLQTAFYFNRYQKRFSSTDEGTQVDNQAGFSNEWKWKLSDPTANKLGIALYGEWGLKGGDELELETKVILDKYLGKNLFAVNIVYELEKEFEWESGKVKSDNWAMPVELDIAYMYNINKNAGLGFELRNHNEIVKNEGWKHSVIFGGPTFNYRSGRWFVIANYLPQWVNLHKTKNAPFRKVLDEHERAEARILIGISL